MSDLLKQSLIRAAEGRKNPQSACETSDNDDIQNQHGRVSQILEVSTWLTGLPSCQSWFHPKFELMSHSVLSGMAHEIVKALSLPSGGIIRQMLRNADIIERNCLYNKIPNGGLKNILSSIIWVFSISNFDQLLIIVYGLYDVYDEDCLDRDTITLLLEDILTMNWISNDSIGAISRDKVSEFRIIFLFFIMKYIPF
jgi:hypothetical protein